MTKHTRRIGIITMAAAAILPLAACGPEDATTPTPAADARVTAPHSTTINPPTSTTRELTDAQRDRVFLKVIAEYGMGGQAAIDAAKSTCDALDAGVSPELVALTALKALDGDIDKAGALLGAGVQAYCPQHSDALASMGGDPA